MADHLRSYVQYIRNTANVPLKTAHFVEDWEPVGFWLLRDLLAQGWITVEDDGIRLTEIAPGPTSA